MTKKWYAISAQEGGRVTVAVRGYIGEWGLTDRQFIAELEASRANELPSEVLVTINSRGGEIDHALAIFNHLRGLAAHGTRIVVRVDGIAASAASVIAMAGDTIIMPANALMMVHAPWTWAAGNADQLRREADTLERFESALIATYQARTGKSVDELKAMLAEDTWMTAQEAVDAGFADRIEPLRSQQEPAAALTMALAQACAIPDDVLARVQQQAAPAEAVAKADNDALATELRNLCAAARMAEMADALLPFARESGLDAARAVLAKAASATGSTSVDPTFSSKASDQPSAHSSNASMSLARLALRAINPRARV